MPREFVVAFGVALVVVDERIADPWTISIVASAQAILVALFVIVGIGAALYEIGSGSLLYDVGQLVRQQVSTRESDRVIAATGEGDV